MITKKPNKKSKSLIVSELERNQKWRWKHQRKVEKGSITNNRILLLSLDCGFTKIAQAFEYWE